jgi:hypothetical protein
MVEIHILKIETIECEDSYEAKKLTGLLAVQKDNTIYVSRIAGTVKNEIIFMLKDKSSHSITLKDEMNVLRLKSLVEDVFAGKKTIIECLSRNHENQVGISTQ